ncbi:hypothetical protein [Xenorhabdus ehlersii]|uniref:Uncharacterized protein n=1 Tax=Xenorhabdus ehlersii TaxID=290111 RepID=A0A2D0ILF4_9GAMM|nr:hypothetical protein [Xenorhabdus ehlersii]PHM22642.1 hypothetical protein Xehl_03518 [Xenorhabdus ehlersii]RKE91822.1 hypothetical protein BDE27_2099 [Xenorhabdus ehlersii]
MAARLEASIFYNEEIKQCEVTWSADGSDDLAPMEKSILEQLATTLMNQLNSGTHHGQLH